MQNSVISIVIWKWMLPELSFSDRWSRWTKLWERDCAKCHERATLRKLWRQTRNSSLLPAKCWPLAVARRLPITLLFVFYRFYPFALLYNKSLNDWSLWEQWNFFPSNFNVETLRFSVKKFAVPLGTIHKCLLFYIPQVRLRWVLYKSTDSRLSSICKKTEELHIAA